MSEPIEFLQRRWKCPHCSRSRARRTATEQHIARCWWNEDNRTCKSCIFFFPAEGARACGTSDCNCPDVPASCDAGVALPDTAALPIVGCEKWRSRDEDIEDVYPPSTSPRS